MRKYSEKTDKFRRKHTFEFCFNEIESYWLVVLLKKKKEIRHGFISVL